MKTIFAWMLCAYMAHTLWATDLPYLTGEFWAHLEPAPSSGVLLPEGSSELTEFRIEQEALTRITEEARNTFAGMIFGYEFSYVPGDRQRSVAEMITITHMATELVGEFSVYSRKVEDSILYAQIRYFPTEAELRRIHAWQDSVRHPSAGSGQGETREEAFEEALRVLIRAYLRSLTASKPKEGNGLLVLEDVPQLFFLKGLYGYDLSANLYAVTYDAYKLY